MGGVNIDNHRIFILFLILAVAITTLGSVSAYDIDSNETISIAETDNIDISKENIEINENDIVTDEPAIGASLDDDDVLSSITPSLSISDTSYTGNLNTGDSIEINVVLTASDNFNYHYGSKTVTMYLNGEKCSEVSMTGDYSGKYTGTFTYKKFYTAGNYNFQAEIPAYQGYSESYNAAKSTTLSYTVTGEDIDPSTIPQDYYMEIYEVDDPNNKTILYYDGIYTLDIYNKLYNNLGLSGSEVKNSLYQSGSGSYNPVYYYVNGVRTADRNSNTVAVWVNGTSEAGQFYSYRNYWQWRPSETGVYEIYAEYSATSALGTLTSNTITVYIGVEPPAEEESTSLTLSASSKINTTESITITPTVLDSQNNPVTAGSIKYSEGDTVLATKTYDEGWTLTIDSSTAGEHTINAVFTADGYASSDATATYTALTPTTLELALNNTEAGAGDVISITPTVSNGDVTSGNVCIYDENDNNIANTTPGVAFEYEIPETASIGTHSFYAVYQEDLTGYHASSRSANKEYKVKGYVTISINLNGEDDVTVGTANARNIVFTVNGDVAVEVNVSQDHIGDQIYELGTYTIDTTNGVDTGAFNFASDLSISHIYAEFAGNDQYFPSRSNNVTLNVIESVTPTVSIDLNATNLIVGDYVLITPKVTYNGENVNVGNLTLYRRYNYQNQETIDTINVGESATFQIPSIEMDGVYAVYNGNAYDENYYYNSANGYREVSVLNPNAISISADTPVFSDSAVTLTATLDNAYKYYDYIIVHFYDGETDLGYASVYGSGDQSNIVLTKDVTFTTMGIHNITARYAGDSRYSACNSTVFKINVIADVKDTTIDLGVSSENIMVDESVVITPAVTYGTDGIVDEGTVSYSYINGTPIDTLDVNTPLSLSNLNAGEYEITAKYNGVDEKYNPTNTNATVSFTVKKYDVELSISVDDVTYPDAPAAVITTNVAGDYVVYINGKKYDVTFAEDELSSSKTVTGEVTAVGTNYLANASISASDKYNAANDSDSFNVNEGSNAAKLNISSETVLPDMVSVGVYDAVPGTYVVSFNDTVGDVSLVVGESGSASQDVVISAGSYMATLSFADGNYTFTPAEFEFKVIKASNSAKLNISSETVLPDMVSVGVYDAVPGTYVVSFNDSAVSSITLTVGESGSASQDVLIPAGSYKATLTYSGAIYEDVSAEVEFRVVEEEQNEVSEIFKIIDYYYPDNSTINYETTGRLLPKYQLNVNGLFTSEEIVLYVNNQPFITMTSSVSHSDYDYSYFYVDGEIASYSLQPGTYTVYAVYNSAAWMGDSYENEKSNTITYIVSGEPVEDYETTLNIYENVSAKTGIINTSPGNLTVIVELSCENISDISEYLTYDSEGNVADSITATLIYPDGTKVSGSANLNASGMTYISIPATAEGWYNVSVKFNGNAKGLGASESNVISYLVSNGETSDNYSTTLTLLDVYNSGSVIRLNVGENMSIAAVLSSDALGDSISSYVGSGETVSLYAYNESSGEFDIFMGSLPINFDSTDSKRGLTAQINAPGWYNFTAVYEGNSVLNTSTSGVLSYYFSQASENETYATELSLVDVYNSGSVIRLDVGENISIAAVLSSDALGDSISGLVASGETVKLYAFNESSGEFDVFVGELPVNFDSTDSKRGLTAQINAPGWYNFTAVYEGNAVLNASVSGILAYYFSDVDDNGTDENLSESSITIDADNTTVNAGDNITFTYTLSEGATGTVTFYDGTTEIGTVNVGENFVVALPEGLHYIEAKYNGDSKFNSSLSNIITVDVKSKGNESDDNSSDENVSESTISIESDVSTVNVGEDISFTYTLTEGAGGTITFYDGSTAIGTVNVGEVFVINSLGEGMHFIEAKYNGDEKFNSSFSNIVIVQVKSSENESSENLSDSSISIEVDNASVDVGDNVTFTYVLSEGATGTVTFFEGDNALGTVNVGDSFTVALAEGNHSIYAKYNGDDKFNTSISNVLAVEVKPLINESGENLSDSSISIEVDNASVNVGDNVTFTYVLSEGATGTITFYDGSAAIATINVGESFTTDALSEGLHFIEARYNGDSKFNTSVSNIAIVEVKSVGNESGENLSDSSISIEVDNPSVEVGVNVTFTYVLSESATGTVTFFEGDAALGTVNVGNSFTVALGEGNHSVYAKYNGDDKFNTSISNVLVVEVKSKSDDNSTENKTLPEMDIDAPESITAGENATVLVKLPENATGNVTIGNITVPSVNGTASVTLSDLPAGENTVPVLYSGDENYESVLSNITITVEENSDIVNAPDVEKYFAGAERFVVNVTDSEGNPLSNKSVAITINGVTYNRKTNVNGTTSIPLGLPSGVYNVTTVVDNKTINSVATIKTTVNGTDIIKVFRNGTQYYATFRDSEGNYLAEGSEVEFNINGVFYTRTVRENGLAKLNINLEQGEYIITAINKNTGEKSSNNITVISRLIENNDLTKYFRNASQYTVKVIGDDGKAVGAGVEVTFNINGVFYTRMTNASGIAKLNINLEAGDYIITAEYAGCKVSNHIKVLPILNATDLTKKFGTRDQFVATLVDSQGNPYAGQSVQFNINGVFYYRTTDSAGNAKLNINLQPGEYIITSSYGGCNIANTVKVNA